MKTVRNTQTASGRTSPALRNSKKVIVVLAIAALSAAVSAAIAADGASGVGTYAPRPTAASTTLSTGTNGATALSSTNIVETIHAELQIVNASIAAAVSQMKAAADGGPTEYAAAASNLAAEIRDLAADKLGDSGAMVSGANALIGKLQGQIAEARARSIDPAIGQHQAYAEILTHLEPGLADLLDAKASVVKVRAELLSQAKSLDGVSTVIGFAADCQVSLVAAQTFRRAISDAVSFSGRIEKLIAQVGQGSKQIVAN
jgi:hypothetical protein